MRSSSNLSSLFVSFFVVLTLFSNVSAQQSGTLRGFVTDSTNGEALVFCNVYLREINIGASTNDRGLYLIKSIPSGKEYKVTVSYES